MRIRRVVLIMIFIAQASFSFAQLNVKVGYGFAYTPASSNSALIGDFNSLNDYRLDRNMEELHYVSGIEIGLNYRYQGLGFELSYDNLSSSKDALGEEPMSGDVFRERLYWGLSGYSLGVENVWGNYGYGVALSRRNHKVSESIANTSEKRSIVEQAVFSTKLHLVFEVGSNESISFQLRPFVNIPWEGLDLSAVRDNLELASSNDSIEKFVTYGISFTFYNGPQR